MQPEEKLARLNGVLAHCKAAPFYAGRITGTPLHSLAELKRIPLTTKDDLRRESPFGLVCVARRELYQYHESYGTTGVPVSVWFTRQDLRDSAAAVAGWGVGLNEDDIILVRFPYAISGVAHLVHAAAQHRQACVIPASARSAVSPFPRVVNLLRKLEVTVLACLPLQALLIAETAEMLGLDPGRDFPHLRAICTAGEPLTEGRRRLLEGIWGVPLFDNYGMTEIGAAVLDCAHGRPHPLEDCLVCEILQDDLMTEAAPGELGQLVATTLQRRATPMVRYLTGDMARMLPGECGCGAARCLEVRGRREQRVCAGGRSLDLWDLDEIVSRLPCRRFWVVGPIPGGLHFVVEREREGDEISGELVGELENRYRTRLRLELVPRGTLCDRGELLASGVVGKPRYIYSAREMEEARYVKSAGM